MTGDLHLWMALSIFGLARPEALSEARGQERSLLIELCDTTGLDASRPSCRRLGTKPHEFSRWQRPSSGKTTVSSRPPHPHNRLESSSFHAFRRSS
jgi:hypothetical protein